MRTIRTTVLRAAIENLYETETDPLVIYCLELITSILRGDNTYADVPKELEEEVNQIERMY